MWVYRLWLFTYGMPVVGVLGFGYAVYEVFTGRLDLKGMGLAPEVGRRFGVLAVIQTLGWALVIIGLQMGASWPHSLAVYNTGLFTFDYVVSTPLYRKIGDNAFKYWAGTCLILLFLYIAWL